MKYEKICFWMTEKVIINDNYIIRIEDLNNYVKSDILNYKEYI